jgi:hypothetical protein
MKKVKRRKSPKRTFVKKFTPCPDYDRKEYSKESISDIEYLLNKLIVMICDNTANFYTYDIEYTEVETLLNTEKTKENLVIELQESIKNLQHENDRLKSNINLLLRMKR